MPQMETLQLLQHPNVVRLLGAFQTPWHLNLIFELCAADLGTVVREYPGRLPLPFIRTILQQILRGVAFCHSRSVLHRDIKSQNVLLTEEGQAKVADFGLARLRDLDAEQAGRAAQYTHAVATRWNRAPELLYGAREYGSAVDLWAVGCILAEMLGHGPLLPGLSDIDQLARVVQLFGSVDLEDWPEAALLPDFHKIQFPETKPRPLEDLLPDAPADAMDLLGRLLVMNPRRRVSAEEALAHPFLRGEGDAAEALRVLKSAWPGTVYNGWTTSPSPTMTSAENRT